MAIDRMSEVAEFLTPISNGQTHDAIPVMGNDVSLRGQDVIAAAKINELVDASNTAEAGLAEEVSSRQAAVNRIDDDIDDLEERVSGTYANGMTANDIRVGLEDGKIERVSGPLTVQNLTITANNEIGPLTKPPSWDDAENEEVVTVAGAEFSYGHHIHSVAIMASGVTTFSLITNPIYQRYRTLVIGSGSTITTVTLPDYDDVAVGVEWRFINLKSSGVLIGNYTLGSDDYVVILRTSGGYLVVGSGTTEVVTA